MYPFVEPQLECLILSIHNFILHLLCSYLCYSIHMQGLDFTARLTGCDTVDNHMRNGSKVVGYVSL